MADENVAKAKKRIIILQILLFIISIVFIVERNILQSRNLKVLNIKKNISPSAGQVPEPKASSAGRLENRLNNFTKEESAGQVSTDYPHRLDNFFNSVKYKTGDFFDDKETKESDFRTREGPYIKKNISPSAGQVPEPKASSAGRLENRLNNFTKEESAGQVSTDYPFVRYRLDNFFDNVKQKSGDFF